jgi:hypothetical protein
VKWSASEKGNLCSATKLLNNVSDNITLDDFLSKKYVCKYQHFWEKEFTWLKKSDTGVGEDMAHCKLCNTNF